MSKPKDFLLQCQDLIMEVLLDYEQAIEIQDNQTEDFELYNHDNCYRTQTELATLCTDNIGCSKRTAIDAIIDLQCGTKKERKKLKLDSYDSSKYSHHPYIYQNSITKVYHISNYAANNYIFGEDNISGTPKKIPQSDVFPDISQNSVTYLPVSNTIYFNVPKHNAQNIADAINASFSLKDIQAYAIAPNLLLCIEIALEYTENDVLYDSGFYVPKDAIIYRNQEFYDRLIDFFYTHNYIINSIYDNISHLQGYTHTEYEDKMNEWLLEQRAEIEKEEERSQHFIPIKRKKKHQ